MKNRIELQRLDNVDSFIRFKIIKQIFNLKNYGSQWVSKKGFTLAQAFSPEVKSRSDKLYVRGSNSSKDEEIMVCTLSYWKKLNVAIKEFNGKINSSIFFTREDDIKACIANPKKEISF